MIRKNEGPLSASSMQMHDAVSAKADGVRAAAKALGFDAFGIARADVSLDRDIDSYKTFVAAGMHGEMDYLARNADVRERLDGEGILAGARSIVCVARRYGPTGGVAPQHALRDTSARTEDVHIGETATIAAYARGRDYHGFLRRRLRRLAAFVRSLGTEEEPVLARPLCDQEPVLERAWAVRAGLGFVGKNGMLIVPGLGSMVLLGEVVTTLDLGPFTPDGPSASPARSSRAEAADAARPASSERCGSCTRCLDVCPTNAFVAPYVLDPRRCVSYLTIEHRSQVRVELREGIGEHLFGCDDCQTVCPYNAGGRARAPLGEDDPFAPLERWSTLRLEALLAMDDAGWSTLVGGTPVKRAGRGGLARNAAVVLGNRGDRASLDALRAAACGHGDPMVREAAAWAAARVERRTGGAG